MGELAALATSVLWSITSIQFTLAGQRVGPQVVNRVRLALSVLLLSLAHVVLYGRLWPIDASLSRWSWLGLSGIVGLVMGDGSLFQAFVRIGPRRSMLLMTLAPVIGAVLAWMWFGETLLWFEVLAILVTVAGVAWVVSEQEDAEKVDRGDGRRHVLGALFGLGGALGQSVGLVLSKQGMVGGFPAMSATLIRLIVACAAIWALALVRGQAGSARHKLRDGKAWLWIAGGVVTGPTLGVWLSMVAVQHAYVGIASTLMSLSPIVLLPLEHWIMKERITGRAVVGTVVALAGASVLLLF